MAKDKNKIVKVAMSIEFHATVDQQKLFDLFMKGGATTLGEYLEAIKAVKDDFTIQAISTKSGATQIDAGGFSLRVSERADDFVINIIGV